VRRRGDDEHLVAVSQSGAGGGHQALHPSGGGPHDEGDIRPPGQAQFKDLDHLHIVGIFPSYETAYAAWKGAAQHTVDNAMVRYFIVHLHRLLEPDASKEGVKA
jgi:hypothetical protein